MALLRYLFRAFDWVRAETTPARLSLGLALGLGLGLFPFACPLWGALFLLSLCLRAQLCAVLLGAALGALLVPVLDPLFHWAGSFFLVRASLRSTWAWLFHAPLLPYTRFYNSVMLGAALLYPPLAVAVVLGGRRLLARHWGNLLTRSMYTGLWQQWHASRLFRRYQQYLESNPPPILTAPEGGPWAARLTPWVRHHTVAVAGVALLVSAVVGVLSLEPWLRRKVETTATHMNGALVEVGDLDFSWTTGRVTLSNVQVGNAWAPNTNLLAFDRLEMDLLVSALLRRKLVVKQSSVHGLKLGSARDGSAEIPHDPNSGAGFIDRAAPGFYPGIRQQLRANPLKYLGALSASLDLDPKIDKLRGQLQSIAELGHWERNIEILTARWEAGEFNLIRDEELEEERARILAAGQRDGGERAEALKEARLSIAKRLRSADEVAAGFSEALLGAERGLAAIPAELDNDISRVKDHLKLPDLSSDDLTHAIFGARILDSLEKVAYWVDLTRRRMPVADRGERMTLLTVPAARGEDFSFANVSGWPGFLLPRLSLESAPDDSAERISGEVYGITTEPSFFGYPMGGRLEMNVPRLQLNGVKASFLVDHTAQFKENFSFEANSFPLDNFPLHESSNLTVKILRAVGSLQATAEFVENRVQAQWNVRLNHVQYEVKSRNLPEELALKNILTPLQSVQLEGSASGPTEELTLESSSNLGRALAAGLRREFRHQMGAIDDSLRRNLQDRAEPTRRALLRRIAAMRKGPLQTLNSRLLALQTLAAEADRLGNPTRSTAQQRP